MTTILSKFDTVTGICTGVSSNGTFVQLDNGMTGFMPDTYLYKNAAVICSVMNIKRENGFVFLALDSIIYNVA